MKPNMLVCACLVWAAFSTPAAATDEEREYKRLFVTSTGVSENMPVFSAPDFVPHSTIVTRVTAGTAVEVLETREVKGKYGPTAWYRVRLPGGQEGWLTAASTGSRIEVGEEDPRLFCTVQLKSPGTQRRIQGYLKESIQGKTHPDYSAVSPGDVIELQDEQLGSVRIRWDDVKSVEITEDKTTVRTQQGSAYIASGPFGLWKREGKLPKAPWENQAKETTVTTTLWLVTLDAEVRIVDLKNATLVLVHK